MASHSYTTCTKFNCHERARFICSSLGDQRMWHLLWDCFNGDKGFILTNDESSIYWLSRPLPNVATVQICFALQRRSMIHITSTILEKQFRKVCNHAMQPCGQSAAAPPPLVRKTGASCSETNKSLQAKTSWTIAIKCFLQRVGGTNATWVHFR